MMYDLSVIVPIYNSEKYLADTLDSVVNQTIFTKLKVILVNDGSTDDSKSICEKYASCYSNIILINKTNGGVSSARNEGLNNVDTEFVTFLDSDDLVEKDYYEKTLNEIKKEECDIFITDFVKVFMNGKSKKYRSFFTKEYNDYYEIMIDFFSGVIGGQVVDKVFKSEIIKDVRFSIDYKIGEDMLFVYSLLKKARKVVMNTNISGYKYMVRSSSAMNGNFSEKFFDPAIISLFMYDDSKNDYVLKDYAYAHYIHESCKTVEYIYRHSAQNLFKEKVESMLKSIRKYKITSAHKFLTKKQFYGFILMKFSPRIYLLFHQIMHIG